MKALILGGARSGKSAFAEALAARWSRPIDASAEGGAVAIRERVYVATAQAFDDEMAARIAAHRRDRGDGWRTVEAPLAAPAALLAEAAPERVVLLDCLTLWLSNALLAERDLDAETDALAAAVRDAAGPVICVSNEVGLGIVPDNALARRFRDAQGRLNQRVASVAEHVAFVAAGLPMTLKGAPV